MEAGRTATPLRQDSDSAYRIESGTKLGVGRAPMLTIGLEDVEMMPNSAVPVAAVAETAQTPTEAE